MPEAVCCFHSPFFHDPAGEHRRGDGGNESHSAYQVRDEKWKSIYYTKIV